MTRLEFLMLPKADRRALVHKLYYDEMRTQKSIAKQLGISQATVQQLCFQHPAHTERALYVHPHTRYRKPRALPMRRGKRILTPRVTAR